MNLRKLYLTNNDCYKCDRTITPKGVMVHSTGANNPYIKRYVQPDDGIIGKNVYGNDWNRAVGLGVHAFIGKVADGSVATYQTLPWSHRGWHCGSGKQGSANNTHISFEICEDSLSDKEYFDKVYREAVELTAHLCDTYSLDPLQDGVVICHSEGCDRGIASNHSDVMHWFPKHGKTMDTFRDEVKAAMVEQVEPIKALITRLPVSSTRVEFIVCDQDKGETLEQVYARLSDKPKVLINGGFFETGSGKAVFNLKVDGNIISENAQYRWGLGIIDGKLRYGGLDYMKPENFISGYPNLIDNYKDTGPITYAKDINYPAERTVLGYDDNDIVILTVHGKSRLEEVKGYLIEQKVRYAVNLDGGGSSRILVDGKAQELTGWARPVSNCVAFYEHTTNETIPEPEKRTLYRVQVGSFSKRDNAERLQAELQKLGYGTIIVTTEV